MSRRCLPLVEELVRRGYRVDFATGDEHAAAVADAGAGWVVIPPLAPFTSPPVGPEAVALWFRHYFFAALK